MSEPIDSSVQRALEWLQNGQSLQNQGRIDEALELYDRAIAAVYRAPTTDINARRLLGVIWMNRANTLQQVGTAVSLAAAVVAYDEAIAVFDTLPIAAEPLLRNHLGAAWLNRGHALLVASDASGIASFEQAIAHLEKLPLEADPHFRLNLAGAWTNLANATLDTAPDRARFAARAALGHLAPVERAHEAFALMSLRARRSLVMSIGEILRLGQAGSPPPADFVSEATDAIDDGLAIAREFEALGGTQLQPLALRLFRLGAQIYGTHQPHFLGEFLAEHLAVPAFAADPEFRAAAGQALAQALAAAQRPRRLVAGEAETARVLATVQSLRAARQRLSDLFNVSSVPLPTSS
jgi:tetratricopeptide (TPR) repeat protein